ncbi:hypothetical protein [Mycolicibacterium sarraceniae]|uniref:Uncharacterized protein n=1 Tax=Mycolicibacterium sarraceniae TaxID=1534348 RepID=A0A7I7SY09_9MYCO|nr:hypothetical protein [Mycolicibacterium sarraceniae]BBY61688.1 hypothetical protein MSAR_48240 [Mycolicibacterium sarraceniae]
MRVDAFAPALRTSQDEGGGVSVTGFPMTSCFADALPAQITVPVVVAVSAPGGGDYDPRLFLTATSPDGQRVGAMEFSWHWPDLPVPVKFRVFAQHLPIRVETAGIYTLRLHQNTDDAETEHLFELPIMQRNPLLTTP